MTKRNLNPQVSAYLKKATAWRQEMQKLRSLLLDCGLAEEFKWGKPCYCFDGHNVVLILALKDHCTLLFCKGALLKSAPKILVQTTGNAQAARYVRFTGVREIAEQESMVKALIDEAIAAEKAGLEIKYKTTSDFAVPEELERKLKSDEAFRTAFKALTPGRQRGYFLHIGAAKQSATRVARIQKCLPQVFKGKGWNER